MAGHVEDFMVQWDCFLQTLEAILPSLAQDQSLQQAIEEVFALIREATGEMEGTLIDEDEDIVKLLTLELTFFCNYASGMAENPPSGPTSEVHSVLNKADTIKSSIEHVLVHLPIKVRKLLEILNELLRLVV